MKVGLFDDVEGLVLHERENLSAVNNMRKSAPSTAGTSRLPDDMPLAMAYVPFQQWGEVFDNGEALDNGTLFPDLVFPFRKGGSKP